MKTFKKPNCNLCMQACLTIMKNIRDKHFTVMNEKSEIYGPCRHKTTFHWFWLSTDDPVFNGWTGYSIKGIFKSYDLKLSTVALNTENFLK